MKTSLTDSPEFQPFTFTVTVETKREAEMLRELYAQSGYLADKLNDISECDWSEANQLFEALGEHAQKVLSR